jgi:glycosyltransferase involved in cell wall biosynthesis
MMSQDVKKEITVLFVTPVLRHPPNGGPALRVENSIKALARISKLTVFSRVSEEHIGGENATAFYKQHCRCFLFSPHLRPESGKMPFAKRVQNFLFRSLLRRNGRAPGLPKASEDYADIVRAARDVGADLIWLGYGNISYPALRAIKETSDVPVVLDTDSVWSRFVFRGVEFAKTDKERERVMEEGRAKEVEEQWGTQLADVTTAVSEVDAAYYRGLTDEPGKVRIFSNVIDLESYAARPPAAAEFTAPGVFLGGSFFSATSPMVDAAKWTLEKVWPIVLERFPDAKLYIVGKGSGRHLQSMAGPSVVVAGEVPSVLPILMHCAVSIVPLRFESGTRFKILESGACRIPVVSTTLGAEGIAVTHGKDILLADEPAAFADAVITTLGDAAASELRAAELLKLVSDGNSIDALAREGLAIIDQLCPAGDSSGK